MDRTKYFWALVECDSESTAAWLYDEMDGIEADGRGLEVERRMKSSVVFWRFQLLWS